MSTTRAGQSAEYRAAGFLEERGFSILHRNYRTRFGELDLVALDRGCLVFVEIRSRADAHHGDALEAVGVSKRKQVAKIAQLYLDRERPRAREIRFDVVGITGDRIDHIIDAFRIGDW